MSARHPRVLSSQLNTRKSRRPYPFGSQCKSAPSDAENGSRVFGDFRRSWSRRECPGQKASLAGSVISILPMFALYVFAQKYIVQGVAGTGLK